MAQNGANKSITSIATICENFLCKEVFQELKKACLDHAENINTAKTEETNRTIIAEDWVGQNTATEKDKNYLMRKVTHAIKGEMIRRQIIRANAGYEYWTNINKQQNYHYDCDEGLRQKHGILRFPVISTVFYISCPTQQEINKGSLILHKETDNIKAIYDLYKKKEDNLSLEIQKIEPKENRLVFFPPRIPHKVEPWRGGTRISLAVNFWKHRPLEESYTDTQLVRTLLRMQIDRQNKNIQQSTKQRPL